jgi:hypothetical protein
MGFLLMLALYLLPALIASGRHHHNAGAIWALTILLGWTMLGWLIALIWSLTSATTAAAANSGVNVNVVQNVNTEEAVRRAISQIAAQQPLAPPSLPEPREISGRVLPPQARAWYDSNLLDDK